MELLDILFIALTAVVFLVGFVFIRRWVRAQRGQPSGPGASSAVEQGRAEAYVLGTNGRAGFGDGGF